MRLKRVEKTQRNFLPYVQNFKHVWKWLQMVQVSLEQAVDVSDDLKDRLKQIIGRIEKLEIYSTKQTDITSNLQKHIVDADK